MPWDEYFGIMESWAKKERIRKDDPRYGDLTPEGIEAYEEKLMKG